MKTVDVKGVIKETIVDLRTEKEKWHQSWHPRPSTNTRLVRQVMVTDKDAGLGIFGEKVIPLRGGNSRLADGMDVIFDISFDQGRPTAIRVRPVEKSKKAKVTA